MYRCSQPKKKKLTDRESILLEFPQALYLRNTYPISVQDYPAYRNWVVPNQKAGTRGCLNYDTF